MRPPPGFQVGHYTDRAHLTGCTVVLCGSGARAAASVRGGAPGTRETDLLRAGMLVREIHAVVLTGGSAFGLDAACGVMRFLEERGIGFPTPWGPVPIVPSAVLFDLGVGDARVRPDHRCGMEACRAASDGDVPEGNVGAGTGASAGKVLGQARAMKAGVGAAAVRVPGGATVAAIAVANCLGEIVDPLGGGILAGPRSLEGRLVSSEEVLLGGPGGTPSFGNTTLVCVMTDLEIDPAELARIAEQAHDGIARAVRPCHTQFDGDTIFALSSGRSSLRGDPLQVGVAAATAVSAALARAATEAVAAGGLPSHRDLESAASGA